MNGIVIDTNVFVAADFNSRSASARIVVAVREGHFLLVWNKPTRRETETILRRQQRAIGIEILSPRAFVARQRLDIL